MRLGTKLGGLMVVVWLAGASMATFGQQTQETRAERDARLLRQLGDKEFTQREAATKELIAMPDPPLDALRQAAKDGEPEIQRRAERILRVVTARLRAEAAQKELARWQGDWVGAEGQKLTIKGDRWISSTPTFGPVAGTLKEMEVRDKMTLVDMVVEVGPTKGHTCRAIYRLEGDTLHYCGSYDADRPTEFKHGGNNVYLAWKRGKHQVALAIPPPPEVQYDGTAFSTDLPLAESKEPIHRVILKIRVRDGGQGKLILDPNLPPFDEFGLPVENARPGPVLILDCTLKLLKNEKQRHLYALQGPKIVSRLSVAYHSSGPEGELRLLVHGKDAKVRYVLDLTPPQLNPPPCHPGCFPAGSHVRVLKGMQKIELLCKGDLVLTLDAEGKPTPAQVTGLFRTKNRVLKVRVAGAELVTTETQPIALAGGGFRPAGELKAGDRIFRWQDGQRRIVLVVKVTAADREVEVFNLVLGDAKSFIVGDFVVRSKPPAIQSLPEPRVVALPAAPIRP